MLRVSTTVNLLGGEIFDNYTTNSDFGGIGIAGGATLNISGNAQVYNNSSNKNSDKRDIKFIDDASKVNVNVLDDFTGNIGIWSSKYYQRSNVFGQVLNNAEISEGTFINNRSNTLHGEKVSSDLIWEYDFENATIITYPTASSTGLIRQTAIGSPTITRDVTIDTLNTDTYTVVNDTFADTNPTITYTLKDTSYGEIVLKYNLPEIGDTGYKWTMFTSPTINSEEK